MKQKIEVIKIVINFIFFVYLVFTYLCCNAYVRFLRKSQMDNIQPIEDQLIETSEVVESSAMMQDEMIQVSF